MRLERVPADRDSSYYDLRSAGTDEVLGLFGDAFIQIAIAEHILCRVMVSV